MDSERSCTIHQASDARVDDNGADIQPVSPFILPPEAEERLQADRRVLPAMYKAIDSIRSSFITRLCNPPDDLEILLLLTYGLQAKQISNLTREQCVILEREIRQRQIGGMSTDGICKYVRSYVDRNLTVVFAHSALPQSHEGRLEILPTPPFGSCLCSNGRQACFLHAYRKFSDHGLPTYLVYTDNGVIMEWHPKYVEVLDGRDEHVHRKAYPIHSEVQLVRNMASVGFQSGRAIIEDHKIDQGILKILVRHPEKKQNEHGDLIEEWVTADKICRTC